MHRRHLPALDGRLPTMRNPSRRLGAVLLGALLALLLAHPVLAHAELVASSPEDGAVLATPPTTVTLTFSEGLDAGKSSILLVGPAGEVASGRPARDGATTMKLGDLSLAPGEYTVKWVSAADDGHLDRGQLGFTVAEITPSPATTPAASEQGSTTPTEAAPTAPPATPAPSTSPLQSPTASPVVAPSPTSTEASGTDVLLPIAVGLVLVAGIGLLVLRRSRGA